MTLVQYLKVNSNICKPIFSSFGVLINKRDHSALCVVTANMRVGKVQCTVQTAEVSSTPQLQCVSVPHINQFLQTQTITHSHVFSSCNNSVPSRFQRKTSVYASASTHGVSIHQEVDGSYEAYFVLCKSASIHTDIMRHLHL